jgi:tRNA (guanine37-N1)-methyltransferase
VLGSDESAGEDSYATGLLEYPQYTRPQDFRGWEVPEVLLSGNHAEVARWRREQSLRRTAKRRPDLLERTVLSDKDREFLSRIRSEEE